MTMARVRQRIDALRSALDVLGHPMRDGTTLGEAALRGFEEAHGIELPEEHRAFLLAFGDHFPVPGLAFGGLRSLEDHAGDAVWASFEGPITEPFPHTGTEPIALEWNDEADDYVRMDAMRGTLCLGSRGCDVVDILVVTGPDRGRVWTFIPGHDFELHPYGLGFFDWVIHRVDLKLAEIRRIVRR